MKRCTHCGATKSLDLFYGDSASRDGYRPECKACTSTRRKAWYQENREREIARVKAWQRANQDRVNASQRAARARPERKQRERDGHLRRTHGITQADYDAMVEAQQGRCRICGRRPAEGKRFHIDHDHTTGRIRGLLCSACNHAVGLLGESPVRLRRAADYVTRSSRTDQRIRLRLERELLRQ